MDRVCRPLHWFAEARNEAKWKQSLVGRTSTSSWSVCKDGLGEDGQGETRRTESCRVLWCRRDVKVLVSQVVCGRRKRLSLVMEGSGGKGRTSEAVGVGRNESGQ